jgi:F-type H+-transporting ATPase subunit delta
MSKISNKEIAKAIYLSYNESKEKGLGDFSLRVARFLSKRRLLPKSKEILYFLEKIINEEEVRIVASVSTRHKMEENLKKDLKVILSSRYSAKEVLLKERVDESLMGGVKVEVGEEVIDFTLKNKLRELKEFLIK